MARARTPPQRRMLATSTSKMGKVDLVAILRREATWAILPKEIREQLYSTLPKPKDGEPAHDIDVHPLSTHYKPYIEEEVRRWQDDLKDGKEAKLWREDAMQAGKDRVEGRFDEWKDMQREEYWGKPEETEHAKMKATSDRIEIEDSQDEEAGGESKK